MSDITKLYGLIGYPLGHSFSQKYFTDKFVKEDIQDAEYRNFPISSITGLPELLKSHPTLSGFNVTIPYKEQVIPYLDSIDPEAKAIGAVNCVKIEDGKLTGYNTDVYGFRNSLLDLIGGQRPAALILGTGGASKAVKYVLSDLGIPHIMVSRTPANGRLTYGGLNEEIIDKHKLIVNTTPLGTFPNTESFPDIPYGLLTEGHFLFDLVYNPSETEFMKQGIVQGAKASNGYDMLTGQAERAWAIWQSVI